MKYTTMTYNKRYDIYVYDTDIYNTYEQNEIKHRRRTAMRLQDRLCNEEEEKLRRRGVCPRCHMILPTSGKCDCCD